MGLCMNTPPPHAATPLSSWLSLEHAATFLGESAKALRSKLERAERLPDGSVSLDGVTARKLGSRWKVSLSAHWLL